MTIYGATLFLLVFGVVLFTLAFGVQWSKTWVTLKAMPSYLQDLFYKNVSPNESAYDLTTQPANKTATVKVAEMPKAEVNDEAELNIQPEKLKPKLALHDTMKWRSVYLPMC